MNAIITINSIAQQVIDNRFYANRQLTAENFKTAEAFSDYQQIVSALAVNCYNSVCNKQSNITAEALKLFNIFGIEAKTVNKYTRRFIVATVQMKRMYSLEYTTARREVKTANGKVEALVEALKKVKPELAEKSAEELSADYSAIATALSDVKKAEAEVTRLEGEPGNIWIDYKGGFRQTGKSGSMKNTATKDTFKKLEDVIADILQERSLMSAKDLLAEAETLKANRKANKKIKSMTEAECLEALGITVNATAK